jgi:hypothetical protein
VITTASLTRLAKRGEDMLGPGKLRPLTYYARANPSATPVTYTDAWGSFELLSLRLTGMAGPGGSPSVIRQDSQLRIALYRVLWVPTKADSVLDEHGHLWRVIDIFDGPGYPFYRLQVRDITPQ